MKFKMILKIWPLIISLFLGFFLFYLNFSTYDFYIHLFFAKHYKQNWFSLIDYQLSSGLDLSTYPPFSHQILALLSFILPLELAGTLLSFFSWLSLAYVSADFFIGYLKIKKEYFWYIWGFVFFSINLLKTIFVFGQLSTIVSFVFGFLALKYFTQALEHSSKKHFMLFVLSFSLTTFSHVLGFLIFTISLLIIGAFKYTNVYKNIKYISLSFLVVTILILLGLYPLVKDLYSNSAVPSQEIPHLSRYPLSSLTTFTMYIYSSFGFTFTSLLLPAFLIKSKFKNKKEILSLYIIALLFFTLSFGKNTPLPSIIFKNIYNWLTYDRFSLFSSILLALFMPVIILYFEIKRIKLLLTIILIVYVIFNLSWLLDIHKLFFGVSVNYQGREREEVKAYILNFLNTNATADYHYQTFGFGKPIGEIYLYSNVPTLDTDYFTGRTIPWLRNAGIEELDTTRNENVLKTFMQQASNYSVKYIFTIDCIIYCDNFYHNFIKKYNWKLIDYKKFNSSSVIVWLNPENVNKINNAKEDIGIANYLWGILPLSVFTVFIILHLKRKL